MPTKHVDIDIQDIFLELKNPDVYRRNEAIRLATDVGRLAAVRAARYGSDFDEELDMVLDLNLLEADMNATNRKLRRAADRVWASLADFTDRRES